MPRQGPPRSRASTRPGVSGGARWTEGEAAARARVAGSRGPTSASRRRTPTDPRRRARKIPSVQTRHGRPRTPADRSPNRPIGRTQPRGHMSVSYRTFDTAAAARPGRRWRLLLPLALVVVLALVWTAFWFYAAARAQTEVAAWNQREAAAGRVLSCATQEFGGFPFRFELRCLAPELRLTKAHVSLKTADMHAAVQVYQTCTAIAEFTGPLDAADDNGHAVAVDWTLAQMSVRVRPSAPPERVSLVLDQPAVTRNGGQETVARATP